MLDFHAAVMSRDDCFGKVVLGYYDVHSPFYSLRNATEPTISSEWSGFKYNNTLETISSDSSFGHEHT